MKLPILAFSGPLRSNQIRLDYMVSSVLNDSTLYTIN